MNVDKKVKNILVELSGENNIKNDMTLQEDLLLDSLLMVTLLIEIEETFNIQLDESDMNPLELTTVKSVIDLVNKYIG
jgi:phosphopantetheine attachment domain protein